MVDDLHRRAAAQAHQPHAHARARCATSSTAVRERGVARERDEAVLGESSLAAPIFDHSGHAVGAIGVVGDTERILPRGPGARASVAAVTEAARGVSRELGARALAGVDLRRVRR